MKFMQRVMQLQFSFDSYSLSREFAKVNFVHENSEANMVAHELARLAKYEDPCTWLDDPPPSLVPLLVHDVKKG